MRQVTSFEEAKQRLDLHDHHVRVWRRHVRPRCENHRQMGFWERNRHVWRGLDMCPYCRGRYTNTGYPPYPGNVLSDVLSVEYGPAITRELNRPTKLFDVCKDADARCSREPKALEVL